MSIDPFYLIQNLFSLVFIIINLTVGIKIIIKYFKYHRIELLLVGIAWIGICMPYIPEVLKLLFFLTKPSLSDVFLIILYVTFNAMVLPFFMMLWLIAITTLLSINKKTRYSIIISVLILSIIFEIILFFFIFTDINSVGVVIETYSVKWSLLIDIMLFVVIGIILITGIIFALESQKSINPKIKLKGKFLLLAFLLLVIGAIIDVLFILIVTNIIARTILIFSSITFYVGFILPDWVKKLFLTTEE